MTHVYDAALSAQPGDDDDFKMKMMRVMALHAWSPTLIRSATASHLPATA